MAKMIVVREYDTITGNTEYINDSRYKYINPRAFMELLTFIREFSGDDENADVLDFVRISYKRDVGDLVTIKNYVGLIQLKSGYQIQILPKISFDKGFDTGHAETKRVFLKMLRSMKDFPSKEFNDANLKVDQMNLYEIFINMYLKEVRQLIKRGLKSAYVSQEENLRFYKGKLLTSQHIKTNIAHAERFYVSYDEFSWNRAENRIVKATLLKLLQLTTSPENAKELRQLLKAFDNIRPSINHEKAFAQVKIDRNTADYKNLIPWSRVFLQNKSFSTFSGKNTARALLFPMESVYESYVAQNIKKAFSPHGWDVSTQDKGFYLFEEPRRQFALRPDIVVKKGKRLIVMDTKWKNLISNERKNYGIQQADMYQMYAYSKKYDTREVWLLYPANAEMRDHEPISFYSEDDTHVRIHFVELGNIIDSLDNLRTVIEENDVYE